MGGCYANEERVLHAIACARCMSIRRHYQKQLFCRVSNEKHSAKALPSVTLGKESSTNCTLAMASMPSTFYRALDKDFAECRQVLDKEKSPSRCQVTTTEPVPSAHRVTLGKGSLIAECPLY
jgi:hypothetical protein